MRYVLIEIIYYTMIHLGMLFKYFSIDTTAHFSMNDLLNTEKEQFTINPVLD